MQPHAQQTPLIGHVERGRSGPQPPVKRVGPEQSSFSDSDPPTPLAGGGTTFGDQFWGPKLFGAAAPKNRPMEENPPTEGQQDNVSHTLSKKIPARKIAQRSLHGGKVNSRALVPPPYPVVKKGSLDMVEIISNFNTRVTSSLHKH